MNDVEALFIGVTSTIRQATQSLNKNAKGIALVVDAQSRLIGTVTDGDIRRIMLAGHSLDAPISLVLDQKNSDPRYAKPITAPIGTPAQDLLNLMRSHVIQQVPIMDEGKRVVDLVTLGDLLPESELSLQAVVMAGGHGTRLRPLTEDLPKPMLLVGDRPLMERIIEQLRESGIQRVNITTHFMAQKIEDHFGDGQAFGVEINYVNEDRPLGTAGALGLMDSPDETLLVINGDILTRVDFRTMLSYHRKYSADLTVGVRQYDVDVPYGVVESNGPFIQQLREKPRYSFFVNAGIYLLEPSVYPYIPGGQQYDMTDLITQLLKTGKSVVSFPIMEYWLDIGQPDDYRQAQEDARNGKF